MIEGYVKARHYVNSAASFRFTHDTWSAISRECEQRFNDKLRVGWHHTHPGYGVFLSSMDQFIHRHFFNLPWMVALVVDPKQEHFDLYRRVTALTPNRMEAGEAVGRDLATDGEVARAGQELVRRLDCDGVLITLGEDGMRLFERGGEETRIPTVAQEVFDVAGAGDTVIAAFTLALASGASMEQAARLANHAAGIVVGKLGVAVATPQELMDRLKRQPRKGPKGERRVTPEVKTRSRSAGITR